jgi:hypothetical protein
MTVALHTCGNSSVAVVDRLGNVLAGVTALVVRAGCRDKEIAGPLLNANLRNASPLKQLDGHPRGHVAHKLAAQRARTFIVLEQMALELIAPT